MPFDREKAREVLRKIEVPAWGQMESTLDALAGCVTDEPQTIDRDALMLFLRTLEPVNAHALAAGILALLRPDPRIAKLEALLDATGFGFPYLQVREVRAILNGRS